MRPLRLAAVAATLAAGLAAAPAWAAEAHPRLELAPDPVGLAETAQLVIEVTVDGRGGADFTPDFRLENLEIAGGPSETHGTSWVNGRTSSSASAVWWLRPLAVGRAAVRDVRLRIGDQTVTLADQEIEVVSVAPQRRRGAAPRGGFDPLDPLGRIFPEDPMAPFRRRTMPAAAQPKIRLHAALDRASAWVGEQVVWRLLLDTQADISAFHPRSLPEFRGFWVREIPLPERLRPEWVEAEGERFGRMTMQQRALYPMRPGRQRIEPVTAEVLARVAEAGWFGPLARDQPIQLATEPLELEVRELPARPAGSAQVVGEIEVASRLDRPRIESGQAATWVVTAAGFGNLRGLLPPVPVLPAGLRLFPPRPESAERVVGGRIRTQLTWSYVLVADRPGVYEVPAVAFPWFDPESGSDRVASSAAVPLEVTGAEAPDGRAAGDPAEPEVAASGREAPLPSSVWWVLGGVAAVGAGAAWAVRRRSRPHAVARGRLSAAIAAAGAEPSARDAAVRLEEAWREYAGARWEIPPGLPVAHWPERLTGAGVPAPVARGLVGLFEELHNLRYAPELSRVEALRDEALELSRRLLRDLR